MIQNDVKMAFRSLKSNKFFTALNILGLALGMSACLTVILIIRDQLGYEKFHPEAGRIYRLLSQAGNPADGGQERAASTPYPLGEKLVSDYAVAEKTVRLARSLNENDATTANGLTLPITGYLTEPAFFEVFGFQLEVGNAATALSEPNSIVLTRKTATRFFGSENPMGKTLAIKGWGTLRVTGIAARPPGKSHIGFECLVSASTLAAIESAYKPEEAEGKLLDNWQNRWMSHTYVKLLPGKTKADLNSALAVLSEKQALKNDADQPVSFSAQALGNITPAPEMLTNEIGFGLPWMFIWVLVAFVVLLIIFPCLNYANLAVARALSRAKEVGIRKVVGARDADLKRLFLTEAVLTAVIALGLAWVLHLVLNNFMQEKVFSAVNLRGSEPISFEADGVTWVAFILFGISVGLFAGWLPARRLSKMLPATSLRGEHYKQAKVSHFGWRTLMTVGQFSVSLVFMILVATLWAQMRFMSLADYGFQKENLLTIDLMGNSAATLAAEMAQDHHINGVCASSILIAGNSMQSCDIWRERGGDKSSIAYIHTDLNYVPVMGLQLVAGENFPANANPQQEQFILLNERAVASFELGTPAEAVGKTMWLSDSMPVTIRGVLKDFNFRPLREAVAPFALRFSPNDCAYLQARLTPGDPAQALAALGSIWKKVDAVHPFEATFMEEKMHNAYLDIELMNGIIGFFALLGLSLACLGLLGMVTYSVSVKVKEIGVRKVVGATVAQVVLLLSKRFLLLLGISIAIALPLGWFLSQMILDFFAYRISIGFAILGGSAAVLLLFGLLTVGVQTLRAALANPVKSLRSE